VRGTVAGLASPHPLGPTLPGLYQDDAFAQRLASAFDEVIAPVFASLDSFDAWLDPLVAPEDVLDWLAGWVGVALDQTWPVERRRSFVASALDLFRLRGTATGLAAHVAIFSGGEVEVVESGAAGWSSKADAAVPGSAQPDLLVRVKVPDPKRVDSARLEALVLAAKPAHMPHRIELLAG
jgi:phage tail-like protein